MPRERTGSGSGSTRMGDAKQIMKTYTQITETVAWLMAVTIFLVGLAMMWKGGGL